MTTIDFAMRVATQLQNENKQAQATIILNNILDVDPMHAGALHLSGIIAYQAGNIASGIQFIQKAIECNASVSLFHSNLGEMFRQLKDNERSIECGKRAVSLDSNSAVALSNLGIAYYDAKEYEKAESCHRQALSLHPTLSASLNNLGSIYKTKGKTQEAIAFYQSAITANPYFVEPINNLGIMLTDLNQFEEALQHFERALTLNSNCAESYYGIAKVHLCQNNFILSEQHINKAIAINKNKSEFYHLLAEIYYEQGKHEKTLHILNHALSIDATSASLHLYKGSVLMEIGESSSAEVQFSKVIDDAAMDNRVLAYYSLVQIRKIKSDNVNLKALLSIADQIDAVSSDKQEYVYFALGKCYDDMHESKKAFDYFTRGCHLKRKRITYNIADQIQFTKKMISVFTREKIDYLRQFSNSSATPIFIIGMPRSGTTLVEQIVASHPDVYGAGELPYFNSLIQRPFENTVYPDNIFQLPPAMLREITDQYLFYLRTISPDAIRITDKMPQNFIAVGLIHALFPNAKIIHVKRNPIDTCLSCYTKLFRQGQLYSYDLSELGQYYICYERIMNHWRDILPSHVWLDVEYENIIQNVESEAKRLIHYCNLTWDNACLRFYESKRQVRTASFMQVREPVYASSVNRWKHLEKELEPLIEMLGLEKCVTSVCKSA